MADKIKMRKQLAAPLLPAPVAKKRQRAFPPLPAVLLISHWGLMNAVVVAISYAIIIVLLITNPCIPPWMRLQRRDLMSEAAMARDARTVALVFRASWCAVPQAAAATAALLLPARRRLISLALSYLVLAAAVWPATASTPGPSTSIDYAKDPVFVRVCYSATIMFFAVGDLLCFLALLVRSDDTSRVR